MWLVFAKGSICWLTSFKFSSWLKWKWKVPEMEVGFFHLRNPAGKGLKEKHLFLHFAECTLYLFSVILAHSGVTRIHVGILVGKMLCRLNHRSSSPTGTLSDDSILYAVDQGFYLLYSCSWIKVIHPRKFLWNHAMSQHNETYPCKFYSPLSVLLLLLPPILKARAASPNSKNICCR